MTPSGPAAVPQPEHTGSSNPDSVPEPRPWLRVVEWILLALLAAHIGVRTLPSAWRTLNTDFPNYYLTARLVREHVDTSRVYEWIWLQRQKDHRQIDQRIVGMVPITPFSTLAVYPLAGLPPLTAKHVWIVINLAFLFATLVLLRSSTRLSWRRVALIAALSVPLRVNFLYGQYYVLLLFLIALACWLYQRQRRFFAGIITGLAAALKIFPVLYLLYFLRKRDWQAFAGGIAGCVVAAVVSFSAFGWQIHRTYLQQVLPAALRGEGLDPYNLKAATLSSLLHRLFIFEPQLNPHPTLQAAWLFAALHPVLQMALIAPALLLVVPCQSSPSRTRLEWATILLVTLALSTSASSYLFTILILPACFLVERLQRQRRHLATALLLLLYFAVGVLGGRNQMADRWRVLFAVPRLYGVILLCIGAFALLFAERPRIRPRLDTTVWAFSLSLVMMLSIAANLHHQRGLYVDYPWRIAMPANVYMASSPASQKDVVSYVAFLADGYHSAVQQGDYVAFSSPGTDDRLAVSASPEHRWEEQTGHQSTVLSTLQAGVTIPQAESPVASFDGHWLAFLREDHGRGSLWVRALRQPGQADRLLTSPQWNVLEMSFLPDGSLIFAASQGSRRGLFMVDTAGTITPLNLGTARYPAVSPDGRWLAYSVFAGGNWNLWLRNQQTGQTRRLTQAACNNTQPTWEADSHTLLYASDCGRALGFSALCRRRVIP